MQFINLKAQYSRIKEDINLAIQRVLEHGQYIMGPEVQVFEQQLADFVGVKHVIANSSGTDSLLMSLMALGIKQGDEVITTPFSFFATVEVILLLNAKPVFVDIDPLTYNLDVTQIENVISPKTKAIMPVSLYGQCANIKKINEMAEKYDIPVVEDGAQSFGATHHGKLSCGLTTIGCTSFFPSKPLGGYGDAGACFTNDDKLAARLREIRVHGQSKRYCHSSLGLNTRIDTIQAAILIEKLKLFPEEVYLRQEVAARYHDLLDSDVEYLPKIEKENTSVYAQYTIQVDNRETFLQKMKELSIPIAVHYPIALHQQTALSNLGFKPGDFPVTEHIAKHVVSLPMHPYLTISEQKKVAQAISKTVGVELVGE